MRHRYTGTDVSKGMLTPGKGDTPAFTPAKAGIRFSDHGRRILGWVDLVGCLHIEVIGLYSPADGQPSRRKITSFIRRSTRALRPSHQPLDVCQQIEAQRRQGGTAVRQLRSLLRSTIRQLAGAEGRCWYCRRQQPRSFARRRHFAGSERRRHVSPECAGCFYTEFVNSSASGGRWTLTRWPHSSMLSLTLRTVTPSWPVHQGL